jgi:hypothetical protein
MIWIIKIRYSRIIFFIDSKLLQKTLYNVYSSICLSYNDNPIKGSISVCPIGGAGIFVIMSGEAFKTDVIVFIGDVIMCFTSDWPINLRMPVTNWPNIFVDQGQFSDTHFIFIFYVSQKPTRACVVLLFKYADYK